MEHPNFTLREEANAITCFAFRNGFLEELHAGKWSEVLDDPAYSRITDTEMKKLMIEASAAVASLLLLKTTNPEKYWEFIARYNRDYTWIWVKDDPKNPE